MHSPRTEIPIAEEPWYAFSKGFQSTSAAFSIAIEALEKLWQKNSCVEIAELKAIWEQYSVDQSVRFLMELIKRDQQIRLERGITFDLYDYLNIFEELRALGSRVVSLAYSEFCLRQAFGDSVEAESFCNKYRDWQQSLRHQLDLHRLLSIPSNELMFHHQVRHFPKPGEVIENFELESELGRGGAARVFLARDKRLGNRFVVIKISADRSTEPEILAKLEHDHIVPVLSVHDAPDGLRLICMPYRGQTTLDRLWSRLYVDQPTWPKRVSDFRKAVKDSATELTPNGLSSESAKTAWIGFPESGSYEKALAWLGWKLATALSHAHSLQIVHRDIKPANILISEKAGPQLLDFNMARDPDAVAHVEDRIRGGTLPYMAPEQLGAFLDSSLWNEIGPQSDIYSLGLVIKELATGQRSEVPFAMHSVLMDQIRILLKQRDQDWKSIRNSKAGISGALDAILEKSLQFRPVDRYRNALELAEDYERLLHGRPLKWAANRSLSERIASGLRPIRYYFVLPLLLFIGWSIWPEADQISVSGLTSLESRLLRDHQFADALAVIRRTSSDQDESTVRDLLYFVSWVETEPDNPLAEEEMKELISRTDLDSALVQANGLIGSNRHLDFIPVYRDFCQISMIYQKSPELISALEWQNLERRFSELQKKWPEDIRLAGFLSYFASMRSDYLTASKHARNGIEIAERSSHPMDEDVSRDLRKREIQCHQLYAATLQTEDRPVEARKYYLETLDKIQQMRGIYHQMADKVLMSFLAEIEIIVSIGIGDVLADLNQLKKANSQFVESKKLLNRYDDSLLDSQLAASLMDSLNLRLNALSEHEIVSSENQLKNQKE